jgi:hypothetical protein
MDVPQQSAPPMLTVDRQLVNELQDFDSVAFLCVHRVARKSTMMQVTPSALMSFPIQRASVAA